MFEQLHFERARTVSTRSVLLRAHIRYVLRSVHAPRSVLRYVQPQIASKVRRYFLSLRLFEPCFIVPQCLGTQRPGPQCPSTATIFVV